MLSHLFAGADILGYEKYRCPVAFCLSQRFAEPAAVVVGPLGALGVRADLRQQQYLESLQLAADRGDLRLFFARVGEPTEGQDRAEACGVLLGDHPLADHWPLARVVSRVEMVAYHLDQCSAL